MLAISMLFLFSAFARTGTAVLAGLAVLLICCFTAGMLPDAARWLPTKLLSVQALAAGQEETAEFVRASISAAVSGGLGYFVALLGFERRLL